MNPPSYFQNPLARHFERFLSHHRALGKRFDSEESALRLLDHFVLKHGRDGGYEPDADLRDFENVPLKDDIDTYFEREVHPHVPDSWMDRSKDKVGYERAARRGTHSLHISTTQLTYINIVV